MSFSIGIVGLPNVGKSTLFKALTKKQVDIANYPFCTIDPNVGVVAVPDERLEIAGLVAGAHKGEGLGNQFLSHIREVAAIAEVVRIFEDQNIIHTSGKINPLSDVETINLELILADLAAVSKRLEKTGREAKSGRKEAILERDLLEKIKKVLEEQKFASQVDVSQAEILYVLNKKSGGVNLDETNDPRYSELMDFFRNNNAVWTVVDAKIEEELSEISDDEKEEYQKALNLKDDGGVGRLIVKSYELLNLITFLTTGEDETRAWTIPAGSTAPRAGRAIHGDFEEKFIKAEIVNWRTLLETGSYAAAREKGLIKTEGREYVVQDGDVIEFKI
ncbi:MAG: GTP-binding protein YchF [Candidatus Azambacteria bacterium GW2011_GWE2_46_45]|uniref:GTP-binding protein YchF n=1 Tax=Candidatus Azambacteria bacterium GW2011_GWE2_46_45 TaxID=1618625 RepID=A0A0G1Q1T4_9BACT|nr:MAG: GTP-binding protein YchF [Candidatus Azambacteria bacterium GW2011_GWE2_46_45]